MRVLKDLVALAFVIAALVLCVIWLKRIYAP